MTVDGTDFLIHEPFPFDKIWYSHKFKHAGVRYEIAVCIQTGWIVWIRGPFPCGAFNDCQIYQQSLKQKLLPTERVEADAGYSNEMTVRLPDDYQGKIEWKWQKGRARARHEAINGKLKEWKAIGNVWRHDVKKHQMTTRAVAAILQSEILEKRGTFMIDYNISPNEVLV